MTLFLPEQIATLRQLCDLWPDTPFVLIGANALALQMDLQWRQTNDLDFVTSIALEDYPAGLATLPGWQRRREGEHAWLSPTGVKVDVVPAGPGLLDSGSLIWPESGYRMNLINPQEREVVTRFVAKARDEEDHHRTHALLIRNGPWLWREHPEVLFDRLAAFEKGVFEALSSP